MPVAHGPAVVLYDASKNPVGVVLDGSIYRLAVSGPLTDTELRASPVIVRPPSTDATRTIITAAISDTQILPTNANRKGAFLYNHSNASLFLGLGSVATSPSDFTFLVSADTVFEIPIGFTGEVRGVWSGQDGVVRVTELT